MLIKTIIQCKVSQYLVAQEGISGNTFVKKFIRYRSVRVISVLRFEPHCEEMCKGTLANLFLQINQLSCLIIRYRLNNPGWILFC